MEMDRYTKDLELIFKSEKYALYVSRETKEVSILTYDHDDLWTLSIDDLGYLGFNHYIDR